MPTASDIAEYLEDQSQGTVGTDIFVNYTPPSVGNVITVTETPGQPPELAIDMDHPGLQIMVRNAAQATAKTKIETIFGLLHLLTNTVIEGNLYYFIEATGSVMPLGQDDKRRFIYAQNYQIMKDRE